MFKGLFPCACASAYISELLSTARFSRLVYRLLIVLHVFVSNRFAFMFSSYLSMKSLINPVDCRSRSIRISAIVNNLPESILKIRAKISESEYMVSGVNP